MGVAVVVAAAMICSCFVVFLVGVMVVIVLRRRKHFGMRDQKARQSQQIIGFTIPTKMPKKFTYVRADKGTFGSSEDVVDLEDTINPELYGGQEDRKESIPCLPGRLCFSVLYEASSEKLIVSVVRGERIRARKSSITATPYVKVCLLPDKRKKVQTKVQKTPHPLFNEEFVFYCPSSELKKRCLRFTVCDFDRFSRQNAIGTVIFPLENHYEEVMRKEGCVEMWRDVEDYISESTSSGEMLFSLQYLPTAKRVAIVIMKGKGFQADSQGKEFCVYVKISLVIAGRSFKNRKTTKKDDLDPVFNESFHFDIADNSLERTSVLVSVVNHKSLIGRVVVGPMLYATGTGLTHWEDMLNAPRKTVAMWHTLF